MKWLGKFVKPATDDIDMDGVVMCLPSPNASGGTKRAQSILTFSMDLTGLNYQYVVSCVEFG